MKKFKVFRDTRTKPLHISLDLAKPLVLYYINGTRDAGSNSGDIIPNDVIEVLPSSTTSIYTDGSFIPRSPLTTSKLSYAWMAFDDDGLLLESSSDSLPSIWPSTHRSEAFAVLSALHTLPPGANVTIYTNCAQLISFRSRFVDTPFIPRMLKENNLLLWTSCRTLLSQKNLTITIEKVPAHSDNALNNAVDAMTLMLILLSTFVHTIELREDFSRVRKTRKCGEPSVLKHFIVQKF